jgi:multicomponent Na+:H+ antiporter subunit C
VPNEAYDKLYANPLPQALMLGATVSGAAMILLALALVIRIRESYGGVEMDEIVAADAADDAGERDAP